MKIFREHVLPLLDIDRLEIVLKSGLTKKSSRRLKERVLDYTRLPDAIGGTPQLEKVAGRFHLGLT